MSISAISTANSTTQNPYIQAKQAFQSLGTALQSGNLSAAQQAFSQLQQYSPNGGQSSTSQSSSSTSSNSTNPLQALGSSLQSGNLSAAQQAFSQLEQQQATGKGHGHHHRGGGKTAASQSTGTSSTTPLPTYSSTGNVQNSQSVLDLGTETPISTTSLNAIA